MKKIFHQNSQPCNPDAELAFETLVRRVVDQRLIALGLVAAATIYTSLSLPPEITSRQVFARELRRLKIGKRVGKIWHVGATEWIEARTAIPTPAPNSKPTTIEQRGDAALENAGLRLVKVGSR